MVISPLIQQISVVQRTPNNGHAIVCKEVCRYLKRKKNPIVCVFINLPFMNYEILEITE